MEDHSPSRLPCRLCTRTLDGRPRARGYRLGVGRTVAGGSGGVPRWRSACAPAALRSPLAPSCKLHAVKVSGDTQVRDLSTYPDISLKKSRQLAGTLRP